VGLWPGLSSRDTGKCELGRAVCSLGDGGEWFCDRRQDVSSVGCVHIGKDVWECATNSRAAGWGRGAGGCCAKSQQEPK